MGLILAACGWGFAEATCFFIVPDVLLTWIVLRRRRLAAPCYLSALLGAMAGGSLLYVYGYRHPEITTAFLIQIPAINSKLVTDSLTAMQSGGGRALLTGSFTGVPYKIFAAQAHAAGIGFSSFILISIPARLMRWLLAGAGVYLADTILLNRFSKKNVDIAFFTFWIQFYMIYFYVMGI